MPENFIDGEWVAAARGRAPRDPLPGATAELVAEIDESTAVDTEAAIAAARSAFDDGPWPRTSAPRARRPAAPGRRPAPARPAELARMESLDTGKRLVESEIDIDDVTSVFRHFGRVADAEAGRVVDTGSADVVSRVVHEPVGVCGADHALELPAAPGLVEGRAGSRRRQHLRAQAERAHPAHRHPPDAAARRGRTPRGVANLVARRRAQRGRAAESRTRASTWSRSPAVSRPASGSWPRPPAPSRRSRSSSAARTPTSSSPTPTSRPRSTWRSPRSSCTPARSARPVRG